MENIYLVEISLTEHAFAFLIDPENGYNLIDPEHGYFLVDIGQENIEETKILLSTHGVDLDYPYIPCVQNAYNFNTRMYDSALLAGHSSNGTGVVSILNGNRLLDQYLQFPWDNGAIKIKVGSIGGSFRTIFAGKIESIEWDISSVNLRLRDRQVIFDRPLQNSIYSGSGGLEGGNDIAGKSKPKCYGNCLNVQPVLVDASNLIYQVNDGQIQSIDSVRFAGLEASPGTDYTVDLATGTFRLLTVPAGIVTCDVHGDNKSVYVEDTSSIVRRIITRQADFNDPDDLNTTSFDEVNSANTSEIGYYAGTDAINISQVLDDLMTGIGGFWGIDRNDKFYIGIIDNNGPFAATFDSSRILSIRRITTPLPVYKTLIGYQRLWYTMQADQLAGAVSEINASYLTTTVRIASTTNNVVKANHPLAGIRDIRGYFALSSDAIAESERQQNLFGADGNFYEITISGLSYNEKIGDIIGIDHDRFTADKAIITGIDENSRTNQAVFTVYESQSIPQDIPNPPPIDPGTQDGSTVDVSISSEGDGYSLESPLGGGIASVIASASGSFSIIDTPSKGSNSNVIVSPYGVGNSSLGFVRPYGDTAAWNQVATLFPLDANSSAYVSLLYTAPNPDGFFGVRGFGAVGSDYTYPVYYVADANDTYTVNCTNGNMDGESIPWNASWTPMPSTQTDRQFILVNESNGYEWNAWQYSSIDTGSKIINCTTCNLIQAGVNLGSGSPGDYRTKVNGYKPSRGVGIQYLAMLVRPEEIDDGVVNHALSMPCMTPNSSSVEGVGWVNPATKPEGHGSSTGIPEGTRFIGRWTQAEVDAQLARINSNIINNGGSGATSAAVQNFAQIIITALQTYGWFITDTSGSNGLQCEGQKSAAAKWAALGLPADVSYGGLIYPRHILRGLITATNFVAIDGRSSYPSNH